MTPAEVLLLDADELDDDRVLRHEPDQAPDEDPAEGGARVLDDWGDRIVYQDWTPETTRVVSGPYGPAHLRKGPGLGFSSYGAARAFWAATHDIVESHRLPGPCRYAFRVRAARHAAG